jgi:type II secretory pathway pseudopilin PulG
MHQRERTQLMKKPRYAFTLFGLLVLLAILGLLMALLLPAIQKVREAANRMKDSNNLKQIAIAIHMYHDDYTQFPVTYGGEIEAVENVAKPRTGSWCYQILPYIEQDALYKGIPRKQDGVSPIYYSPLRRSPSMYGGKSKIDYAANVGTGDDPAKNDPDDGFFGKKPTKFASIVDGTSNTIAAGVKGMRTTEYLTGKGLGDSGSCWTGSTIETLRTSDGDKRPPLRDVANEDHERGFGGPSPAGVNFMFGDGSVRSIHFKIRGDIFKALCTRDGGEVVPLDF